MRLWTRFSPRISRVSNSGGLTFCPLIANRTGFSNWPSFKPIVSASDRNSVSMLSCFSQEAVPVGWRYIQLLRIVWEKRIQDFGTVFSHVIIYLGALRRNIVSRTLPHMCQHVSPGTGIFLQTPVPKLLEAARATSGPQNSKRDA